jgi:type II secretory pathway pseudopilin PulG
MNPFIKERGQSLIEILIVIALLAVLLPPLFMTLMASRDGKIQQGKRSDAAFLMKESQEALRMARENGWSAFAAAGTYHPTLDTDRWTLTAGSEVTASGFIRQIEIFDVNRLNNQIVLTGGTYDPSTKRAVITISWNEPINSSISSTHYFTRYLENAVYTQTTKADFDTGLLANVQTTSTVDGEVSLANNTKAKWCSPAFSPTTIDLPDGPPIAVDAHADADSNTVPNDVFAAVAPEATTSVKLAHIHVSANADPPTANLQGIFTLDPSQYSNPSYVPTGISLTNSFKTNDVKYYESASGKKYALLATDLPNEEVVVVQVHDGSAPSYQDPVNKIYKYWTSFSTRIYGVAAAPSTPTSTPTPTLTPTPTPIGGSAETNFFNPSANAADTGGDGNGYATNPTNAYTANSSYAVDSNSGSGTSTSCTSNQKDRHRFYNYNVSLPGGTTVRGIEIRLDGRVDSTTGSPEFCVQLSWDGGTTWTTAQTTSTLTTSNASYILGGASDTWGRTWSTTDLNNTNFRVRVINVASNTSRDFSLDWAGVKIHYSGGTPTNTPTPTPTLTPTPFVAGTPGTNDQAPFGYGAKAITVLEDRAYVASSGYLYVIDLSSIDSKSPSVALDQLGCRIQLNGYDCQPGTGTDRKYSAGQSGTTWSDTTTPVHNDCSDGGNIELHASNDLSGVKVGINNYIYVAVGAGTNPEMDIVNATSVPSTSSSPSISNSSCGRISGGNSGWKTVGSLDLNNTSGTEEAANSVYAKSDGTRAYLSSNGGIDANNDGQPDSKQFYVINTTNKNSPAFLSGGGSGATSGFYYGTNPEDDLFPRRSLTVLNGERAILVGKDGFTSNAKNPKDYQVLDITTEASPGFCGGVDFDSGFNDLTSVVEADHDTFVYMVANTQDKQLKIIEGGPDGTFMNEGTYESAAFDGSYARAFNRFSPVFSQPANTTINFQIGIADAVNGSCTGVTYTYTGPDGTDQSFYTTTDGIAINDDNTAYENPGQCMKYKAFLRTTDYNNTPILQSISINYSP